MELLHATIARIVSMVPASMSRRIYHWILKGGLSVLDQGIYSGANFIFSVLLARWLSPLEYGAYALAFAVLLIFYQFHQSLITDPMGVLGPAYHANQLRAYLMVQAKMHFFTTVPIGLAVGLACFGVTLGERDEAALFARNLGLMGILLPFSLLPWFLRRAFYVVRRPEVSAVGSAVYAASVFASLLLLRHLNLLNSYTAIGAMAFAGLVGGVVPFFRLARLEGEASTLAFDRVFAQNWNYARWLVAAAIFMVCAGQVQIFLAGKILGIRAAGVIDVVQSFSQPMVLTIGAVTAFVIPSLSLDYARNNSVALERKVLLVTIFLFVLSLSYVVGLFFLKDSLEGMLYGGKFSAFVDLIPLFGVVPVLLSLYWGPAIGLQAAHRPQAVLIVACIWLPASVALVYAFTTRWGLVGAASGTILGYVCMVAVCWLLYRKWVTRGAYAL